MPKLTLTNLTSGYLTQTVINDNFTAIEAALENTLSRDGTSPNTMSANLDMNTRKIENLADGSAAQDAATFGQISGQAAAEVTYENLDANGDIGFTANKVPDGGATQTAIDAVQTNLDDHEAVTSGNPHGVDADDVNLGATDDVTFNQVTVQRVGNAILMTGAGNVNIRKQGGTGNLNLYMDAGTGNLNIFSADDASNTAIAVSSTGKFSAREGVRLGDGTINQSDTEITRASAGEAAVAGKRLLNTGDLPVSVANGGTGESTRQEAIDALTASAGATANHVLTVNGSGEAVFLANPGASGGEINTQSNTGSGAEVSKTKSGVDFPFRTLVGEDGVSVTEEPDEIKIKSNAQFAILNGSTTGYTSGYLNIRLIESNGPFMCDSTTTDWGTDATFVGADGTWFDVDAQVHQEVSMADGDLTTIGLEVRVNGTIVNANVGEGISERANPSGAGSSIFAQATVKTAIQLDFGDEVSFYRTTAGDTPSGSSNAFFSAKLTEIFPTTEIAMEDYQGTDGIAGTGWQRFGGTNDFVGGALTLNQNGGILINDSIQGLEANTDYVVTFRDANLPAGINIDISLFNGSAFTMLEGTNQVTVTSGASLGNGLFLQNNTNPGNLVALAIGAILVKKVET